MEDGHDERVSTAVCLLARHRKHEDNIVKMEVCGVLSEGRYKGWRCGKRASVQMEEGTLLSTN